MQRPRIVIGGERSGVGKSTITVGILLALKERGLDPQPFKTGPDFLDPMHHSALLDRISRNLDTWMFPRAVPELFAHASEGAGISVIEGVMGLYDGFDGRSEEGSTAHLSKVLKAPVVLVLDASSSARSVGAVSLGFKEYDRDVDLPAVIFNNVAGQRHLEMLQDSLRGIECLGGIPSQARARLESRHLGLVPLGEETEWERYEHIRWLVEDNVDMGRLIEIARSAPPLDVPIDDVPKTSSRVRIGVARDGAFNFYYEDNFQYLRRAGAELIFFSPLHDDVPEVDGLYIGGGYPEMHASTLEGNAPLRRKIATLSEDGMPIYAEGGGLMYLCRRLHDQEGRAHDMVGIFDAEVEMTSRLQALGYLEAEAVRDTILLPRGSTLRGHAFHYSRIIDPPKDGYAYRLGRGKGIRDSLDGMVSNNTLASYAHLHFGYCPEWAENLVAACMRYRRR